MSYKSFEELDVWQSSCDLAVRIEICTPKT
jgi:hypothetical protein